MKHLVWRTWKVKVLRELRVRSSGAVDALLYFFRIPPTLPAEAKVTDGLIYVAELLMARAGRMAKWVTRLSGRKVVLFCHSEGFIPEFADGFTAIVRYRNAWHLRRLLRALPRPWLIHGFAPKSHYPDVARRAMPDVPYVHDLQDTLVVYYGTAPTKRWLRVELPHEKACMAEADGVIAHSLEPAEGFRRYAIPHDKRPPTLFFPLYCDDDRFISGVPKISGTEIHLVYAGGVAGSHRDPRYFGNIQFFGLIDTLTKQGLHLHIYPSPTTLEADRAEYVELARKNERFHYHAPVPQEKLAGELARYHFGLIPFFVERSDQSPEKLKYATALKLFNFIESGLPVVVSKDLGFQSWMAARSAAGVAVGPDDLTGLAALLRTFDTGQVSVGRGDLSLKANVPRLLEFYDRVSERSRNDQRV
ncbi:MAG TPA: glycosyltransferase [Flavobacteriales bacterium]|nr:glycosyltransferase [Flavobacteriales bacterium]